MFTVDPVALFDINVPWQEALSSRRIQLVQRRPLTILPTFQGNCGPSTEEVVALRLRRLRVIWWQVISWVHVAVWVRFFNSYAVSFHHL